MLLFTVVTTIWFIFLIRADTDANVKELARSGQRMLVIEQNARKCREEVRESQSLHNCLFYADVVNASLAMVEECESAYFAQLTAQASEDFQKLSPDKKKSRREHLNAYREYEDKGHQMFGSCSNEMAEASRRLDFQRLKHEYCSLSTPLCRKEFNTDVSSNGATATDKYCPLLGLLNSHVVKLQQETSADFVNRNTACETARMDAYDALYSSIIDVSTSDPTGSASSPSPPTSGESQDSSRKKNENHPRYEELVE